MTQGYEHGMLTATERPAGFDARLDEWLRGRVQAAALNARDGNSTLFAVPDGLAAHEHALLDRLRLLGVPHSTTPNALGSGRTLTVLGRRETIEGAKKLGVLA